MGLWGCFRSQYGFDAVVTLDEMKVVGFDRCQRKSRLVNMHDETDTLGACIRCLATVLSPDVYDFGLVGSLNRFIESSNCYTYCSFAYQMLGRD